MRKSSLQRNLQWRWRDGAPMTLQCCSRGDSCARLAGCLNASKGVSPTMPFRVHRGSASILAASCNPLPHESMARRSYKGRAEVFAHGEIVPCWRGQRCSAVLASGPATRRTAPAMSLQLSHSRRHFFGWPSHVSLPHPEAPASIRWLASFARGSHAIAITLPIEAISLSARTFLPRLKTGVSGRKVFVKLSESVRDLINYFAPPRWR
jgi:hypothetical protein